MSTKVNADVKQFNNFWKQRLLSFQHSLETEKALMMISLISVADFQGIIALKLQKLIGQLIGEEEKPKCKYKETLK